MFHSQHPYTVFADNIKSAAGALIEEVATACAARQQIKIAEAAEDAPVKKVRKTKNEYSKLERATNLISLLGEIEAMAAEAPGLFETAFQLVQFYTEQTQLDLSDVHDVLNYDKEALELIWLHFDGLGNELIRQGQDAAADRIKGGNISADDLNLYTELLTRNYAAWHAIWPPYNALNTAQSHAMAQTALMITSYLAAHQLNYSLTPVSAAAPVASIDKSSAAVMPPPRRRKSCGNTKTGIECIIADAAPHHITSKDPAGDIVGGEQYQGVSTAPFIISFDQKTDPPSIFAQMCLMDGGFIKGLNSIPLKNGYSTRAAQSKAIANSLTSFLSASDMERSRASTWHYQTQSVGKEGNVHLIRVLHEFRVILYTEGGNRFTAVGIFKKGDRRFSLGGEDFRLRGEAFLPSFKRAKEAWAKIPWLQDMTTLFGQTPLYKYGEP